MGKFRIGTVLAAVTVTFGALSLMGATPTAAAYPCGSVAVGSVANSGHSWTQQAFAQQCSQTGPTTRAYAWLYFASYGQFAQINVQACTAHLQLTHVGGTTSDKTVDCYAATQAPDGGNTDSVFWDIGDGSGAYVLSGYANVRTGTYYSGAGNPSTLTFRAALG